MLVPSLLPVQPKPNPLRRLWRAMTKGSTMLEPKTESLTNGALACSGCGVAVPLAEAVTRGIEKVHSFGREIRPGEPHGLASKESESEMSRCGSCSVRRDEAVELMTKYPEGRGQYRSDSLAHNLAENALLALAAIGEQVTIESDRELRLLCAVLAEHGQRLSWRARFAPIAMRTAKSDTAAVRSFAHVREDDLVAVRAEFARYRVLRAERPIDLAPPIGSGCYLCGVGSVKARPSRRNHVWRTGRVRPSQLGGTDTTPREVAMCAECHLQGEAFGVYGPTVLDRLVLRAAGVDRLLGSEYLQLHGVKAWGTCGRTKPNSTPFAHLDLSGLLADVRGGNIDRRAV